jgi:hypothetical protein
MVLAVFLSFIYSAIWPSGKMDLWIPNSTDYYTWIFCSEYLVGGINPTVMELSHNIFPIFQDAFGTYIILAFVSVANLLTPLSAASTLTVTFLTWCATSVYCLIKKSFGLKPTLALALTLVLVSGSLFNYLGIQGMFGHLIAMLAFLTALGELLTPSTPWPTEKLIRKLFFPLFLIFLAYQSGYIIYCSFIALTSIILSFLYLKNYSLSK